MENETKNPQKKGLMYYLKKYSYYIALGVLLVILSVAIVLTSVLYGSNEEEVEPTSSTTISFDLPVMNATVLKGFSDTELQYNATSNVWETHKAVDFYAEIGTDVLACFDGTVSNVYTNILDGTVVEIDHGDGLKTTYGSLSSEVKVAVGDVVKKGDIIGKASNSATSEVSESGQVHFEVWKDGSAVDPANYMDISTSK
jgi:murein DD-endopeptidase MepM/ murein hydrolase activator NlpD